MSDKPTTAGSYKLRAVVEATTNYAGATSAEVDFEIYQAEPVVSRNPTFGPSYVGQKLKDVLIRENALTSVPGSFTWSNQNETINSTRQTVVLKFTPSNANYADVTINVVLESVQLTITIPNNVVVNGSVSGRLVSRHAIKYGEILSIMAILPESHIVSMPLKVNGVEFTSGSTLSVTSNIIIEYEVNPILYSITIEPCVNGEITVNKLTNISAETAITIDVNPDLYYQISKLLIQGENAQSYTYVEKSENSYQFAMPRSNVKIFAEFALVKVDLIDNKNDVEIISTQDILTEGVYLQVSEQTEEDVVYEQVNEAIGGFNKIVIFDITLYNSDREKIILGEEEFVTVKIKISEEFNAEKIKVWRVENDGTKILYNHTIEEKNGVYYAVLKTNHFSLYVMSEEIKSELNLIILLSVVGGVVVTFIVTLTTIMIITKKKEKIKELNFKINKVA